MDGALLRRLPTKDRLRRWGLNVPAECVLCSSALETHHHLFFECTFSSAIWQGFASQIRTNPPADLHAAAAWILSSSSQISREEVTLFKLIFQSTIYLIWKERNARIFSSVSTSSSGIHLSLDRLLRDRLLSLSLQFLQPALRSSRFILKGSCCCSLVVLLLFIWMRFLRL